jgi:hypothetical protein
MISLGIRTTMPSSFTLVFGCFAGWFFHVSFSVLGLISLVMQFIFLQLLSLFPIGFTDWFHPKVGSAFEVCRQSSK